MRYAVLLFSLMLAACGGERDRGPAAPQISGDGDFTLETERYSVELRIPGTANELARESMVSFLQSQLNQLHAVSLDEPESGYFDSHRYTLTSHWETAESDAIYTFILRGDLYTGGAHGSPFLGTFSYSKDDHAAIDLDTVLGDPRNLAKIAGLSKPYFRRRLGNGVSMDGLSPDSDNWRQWFVSNNRLTFLFPPYQIASYADGEQQFPLMIEPATQHLVNLEFFDVYAPPVSSADEHGHGPDPGSQEAAASLAWQLVKASSAYVEDGHDLEITDSVQVDGGGWRVRYAWRHYGDPDHLYTGAVDVDDDTAVFVASEFGLVAVGSAESDQD